MRRIVIIGNSGSGKSYLAKRLGERLSIRPIHLDDWFWEPGGYNKKRPTELVIQEIEVAREQDRWIAEGVYGEFAALFLDQADGLIWLDMDWEYCRENLMRRHLERTSATGDAHEDETFPELLAYASNYWTRDNARSFTFHKALYDSFRGRKYRLKSRAEVDLMLTDPTALDD